MNEFLVKCIENERNYWIDISTGQQFEKCNVPYNLARHGLCKTLNRKVLKKIINDGFEPLVFMSIEKTNPKLPQKGISFPYRTEDKAKATWFFAPYGIMEAIKGLEEDMSDRELSIMLFAPRNVVKELRYKLEGGLIEKIMKEIGGDVENDKRRNKGVAVRRIAHVKGTRQISW